jgi:hypothetical protein
MLVALLPCADQILIHIRPDLVPFERKMKQTGKNLKSPG